MVNYNIKSIKEINKEISRIIYNWKRIRLIYYLYSKRLIKVINGFYIKGTDYYKIRLFTNNYNKNIKLKT